MTLLAPLMLLGLLGLSLPVLAHLLGRKPPLTVRFAGRRFLEPREPTVTQRRALHDLPLMLLRLALLAALIFALARPVTPDRSGLAIVGEPHDAVIVLDVSRSMELVVQGRALREHALARAEDIVRSLPDGSRVGLVTSDGEGPRVELTAARERVLGAIDELAGKADWRRGAWKLGDGVNDATQLLPPDGGDRKRVIYAIGDATAGGVGSVPVDTGDGIVTVPVLAFGEPGQAYVPPEHVAITQVGWVPAPELDPRAIRIRAEVRRYVANAKEAQDDKRAVGVVLEIAGQEVSRGEVDVLPNDAAVVELTHTLLDTTEPLEASVRLLDTGDPLPSDDHRELWLSARDRVRVGVINGDPSEMRTNDETFFLSTALVTATNNRGVHVRGLAPDQLESLVEAEGTAGLAEFDVLVLANVRAPRQDVASAIRERVEAGMGLWIAVGDRVEPKDYNAIFDPLLPLRMRGAQLAGSLPGRTNQRTESLAPANLAHPIFAELEVGSGAEVGLGSTKTRRLMLLDPDPKRGAKAALTYSSGGPALVTREVGRGRVALLTTTIDRDWTDLPLRPGFVPTAQHTVAWLAGRTGGTASAEVTIGQPWISSSDVQLSVETPAGISVPLVPDEDGRVALDDTWRAGHYTVRRQVQSADTEESTTPFRVFAGVVDPSESDTTPVEPPGEAEVTGDGVTAQVRINRPRWRGLLLVGLALFAIEAVLRTRARPRATRGGTTASAS